MKLIIQNARVVAEATDDYAGPMDWIEAPEGYELGSFLLPGEARPVPAFCSRRQGLQALLAHGHRRAEIEALIAAIPDDLEREAAQSDYEADTWERDNQFVQQMWAQMGGTPEQLDNLFRMAVAI